MRKLHPKKVFGAVYRKSGSRVYATLVLLMIGVAVCGLLTSASLALIAGFADGLFFDPFCLQKDCIDRFVSGYSYAYSALAGTVAFLVAMATVGGIFVALSSYLTTAGASAFGNHISHLGIFQAYLNSEISKRPRVSSSSLDVFFWYGLIFPSAGSGNMLVSDCYKDVVGQLRREIETSNAQATTARAGSFRYVEHQNRIITALARFGIKLNRQPRVEFFEIEDELFSLVRAVNFSFCKNDPSCDVPLRLYF